LIRPFDLDPALAMKPAYSRRSFLCTAAAATTAALGKLSFGADSSDPFGGFKMGLQSYTLRAFDAKTALEHTKTLGLKYWESYPDHVPPATLPSMIEASRQLLMDHGVTLLAYGVVAFDENENKARSMFDFAKAMGIVSLSADPKPNKETFDLLDKLVAEYDVAIAIHNHGPGHRYDKADDVVKVVKDRHPKIGACVDTGHYLRSDENPVEVIQKLGKRVFGVHLKDVRTIRDAAEQAKFEKTIPKHRFEALKREGKLFTILGEGELDIVGCLKELRKLDYQNCLSLEYEENEKNPLSDVEACIEAVRTAVKKLA
jgi:sugar phosphate isomerase/epimerase